ncbi:hypothetical protein HKX48_002686 [Thoreauomyces humboldtii]|nr:hypothetical protein HKX48_002686 [Thoreauomyces humboldtii]
MAGSTASFSTIAGGGSINRDLSRERLDGIRGKGGKKKFGSLGNLVGQRDSTATGQLRARAAPYRDTSEIFTVKYSLDDEYLAAGLGDGRISIISTRTNEFLTTLKPSQTIDTPLPCTSIAFRPDAPAYKNNKNVLAAAYASGDIIHHHLHSPTPISVIHEPDNQPTCIVYNTSGTQFATGGSDCVVRVYDGKEMRVACELRNGTGGLEAETAGHSNRIFAVKFHPTETWCLISAGWDNTVQIWDTRQTRSISSFYGPHVCGDALDFLSPTQLVTGSYRKENPLQTWSIASFSTSSSSSTPPAPLSSTSSPGVEPETVPWCHADNPDPLTSLLYSVNVSRSGKYVVAAGGMATCVKVFSTITKRPMGMVTNLPGTVYSAAMSNDEKMVAFGGSSMELSMYDVDLVGLTDFLY